MDIEKTMQFIVEMQAQRAIAIQKLDEQMANYETRLANLEGSMATFTDLVGRLPRLNSALWNGWVNSPPRTPTPTSAWTL